MERYTNEMWTERGRLMELRERGHRCCKNESNNFVLIIAKERGVIRKQIDDVAKSRPANSSSMYNSGLEKHCEYCYYEKIRKPLQMRWSICPHDCQGQRRNDTVSRSLQLADK